MGSDGPRGKCKIDISLQFTDLKGLGEDEGEARLLHSLPAKNIAI